MRYVAGLDWGSSEHAICVLGEDGREAARFAASHAAEGLAELRRRLARFGSPAELPIAIERPTGLLVDTLVEAGHACAWAAEVCRRARGRGCDHPHAIRILARAWTRVLWRAWQDGTPYDPAHHRSARLPNAT